MKNRFEKGYTLAEMLVVVLLIAIIAGLTIAAFSRFYQQYRLSIVTRQVATSISYARLRAVATNMKYTFTLQTNPSPTVFNASGTNDLDNSGTLQPWEDVMGTGAIFTDTLYPTSRTFDTPTVVVDHAGISTLPNGAAISSAMDSGQTLTAVFDGRGIPTSMQAGGTDKSYIVLQSQGFTQAIFVADTGMIRIYRYVSPGWTELR
jgi:prepilin-type N-terminal cleavage/methylation domain-containing protein